MIKTNHATVRQTIKTDYAPLKPKREKRKYERHKKKVLLVYYDPAAVSLVISNPWSDGTAQLLTQTSLVAYGTCSPDPSLITSAWVVYRGTTTPVGTCTVITNPANFPPGVPVDADWAVDCTNLPANTALTFFIRAQNGTQVTTQSADFTTPP
jgi:hypothetical protein